MAFAGDGSALSPMARQTLAMDCGAVQSAYCAIGAQPARAASREAFCGGGGRVRAMRNVVPKAVTPRSRQLPKLR
jgi:hypothetical protein